MSLADRITALAACKTSVDLVAACDSLAKDPAVQHAESSTLMSDALHAEFGVAWPVFVRDRFRAAGLIPRGTIEAEWTAIATLIDSLPVRDA